MFKAFTIFLLTGVLLPALVISAGCTNSDKQEIRTAATPEAETREALPQPISEEAAKTLQHATFAMGCFWHSEEMFLELKGVKEALPGYSGGSKENPTYEEVGEEQTGHAESVDVTFDPAVISYEQLLTVFFTEHDPTTPNMAYPDHGPQYRSMVFYRNAEQQKQAEAYIAKLTAAHTYDKPIITEVAPFKKFYQAEDYHLRYYRKHPDQSYIAHVTKPEIEKFRKDFAGLLQ